STLNLLRAFTGGGFADLREVHSWNRGFTSGAGYDRYEELAGQIDKAVRFMDAIGAGFEGLTVVEVYATPEAPLRDLGEAVAGIGVAGVRAVASWIRGFASGAGYDRYEELAGQIDEAVRFMDAIGADFDALKVVEFYASHEALLLDYEEALSRIDSRTGEIYGCSGHFLWIGERTRQLDGAHVDFMARLRNPIGVKLGPTATVDDALRLVDRLDPDREPGRLTFITRMGAGNIRDRLPALVEGVRDSGAQVAW